MSARRQVSTPLAPGSTSPLSQAVVVNNMVFVSGQLGFKLDGSLVEGGIEEEARLTFKNIEEILKAAGSKVEDLVKVGVILKDFSEFEAMNKVYREFIAPCKFAPARTTFQAGYMPANSRIEVDAIAVISKE